jgi:chemotaxis protein methyltransferase CheR
VPAAQALSPDGLRTLKQLLLKRSGNRLPAAGHVLEWRLRQVAWDWNMGGLDELFLRLEEGNDARLENAVVDALVDGDTWFFRDEETFKGIHAMVLPDLYKLRAAQKFLSIWSPGAGSGQEVYSIILSIRHHFPAMREWDLRVLGTDINEAALERAREASYSDAEVRHGLPLALIARYFIHAGGKWILRPEIRLQAAFQAGDLTQGMGQDVPSFDLVCVRNLLARIDPSLQRAAIDNAANQVAERGYLVLGNSEMASGLAPDPKAFRPMGGGIFKSFRQIW